MTSREWLCLWYLRLNGYFTLPNFYAHGRRGPLTEVDVLAARFSHSREFEDDAALAIPADRIDVIFAEAKTKVVEALNGPWGSPEKGALDYVLRRVGVVSAGSETELAECLYSKRQAVTDGVQVRVVCFGTGIGEELRKQGVHFVSWEQVLSFINKRFRDNDRLKADHETWDDFGQYLWRMLSSHRVPDADAFLLEWDRRNRERD